MKHTPLKTISLKNHPQLNEKWVQQVISDDPSILRLGELSLVGMEKTQPSGGRLDLLLRNESGSTRYEVELQLGATDETHIIRTIEYWDIERRRYPNINHIAVIIAENVTARFLNVISLFNGHIPIIALQITAIETSEGIGLHFTKVLDAVQLGIPEEDEANLQPADRKYWEDSGTPKTVKIADEVLALAKTIDSTLVLKYNRVYIGFSKGGIAFNFAIMRAKKSFLNLSIRLPETQETTELLEKANLVLLDHAGQFYRIKLDSTTVENHKELLLTLMKAAYENRE